MIEQAHLAAWLSESWVPAGAAEADVAEMPFKTDGSKQLERFVEDANSSKRVSGNVESFFVMSVRVCHACIYHQWTKRGLTQTNLSGLVVLQMQASVQWEEPQRAN